MQDFVKHVHEAWERKLKQTKAYWFLNDVLFRMLLSFNCYYHPLKPPLYSVCTICFRTSVTYVVKTRELSKSILAAYQMFWGILQPSKLFWTTSQQTNLFEVISFLATAPSFPNHFKKRTNYPDHLKHLEHCDDEQNVWNEHPIIRMKILCSLVSNSLELFEQVRTSVYLSQKVTTIMIWGNSLGKSGMGFWELGFLEINLSTLPSYRR